MSLPGQIPAQGDQLLRYRLLALSAFAEDAKVQFDALAADAASSGAAIVALAARVAALEADEQWHAVGATGEPAFEHGWAATDPVNTPAGFYKDARGIVRLQGVIASGTIAEAAFTLPEGYRPPLRQNLPAVSDSATYTLLVVEPDGKVVPFAGATTWFSMDGLAFRGAP